MQHTVRTTNGIATYSTTDAVFRTLNNKPIIMEYHSYCGPFFSLDGEDFNWLPEEDSREWDNLWKQFEGWWSAKGFDIYIKKGL